MKSTGIVRQVDQLGRVVVPKETRNVLGMPVGTPIEVWVDGDTIVLKKFSCAVCGGMEDLTEFKGQKVCAECRTALAAL